MIDAIYKAHEVNQQIIAFIDTIVAECGKPKHESYSTLSGKKSIPSLGFSEAVAVDSTVVSP